MVSTVVLSCRADSPEHAALCLS